MKGSLMKELEKIYKKYFKDVYYFLLNKTGDPSLAEDLASETFLGALKTLPKFKGDSSVKTWLFSIAKHQWYNHLRKEKPLLVDSELAEDTFFVQSSEDAIVSKELLRRIYRWLEEEPGRNRDIFLSRIQGYSYQEIGNRYSISSGSARVIVYRMRKKLKKDLEKEGYDELTL